MTTTENTNVVAPNFGKPVAKKTNKKAEAKKRSEAAQKAKAERAAKLKAEKKGSVTVPKTAPKPKKDQSSGAFIQEQLLKGTKLTDEQLAEIVRRAYPDRTTTVKDVQWNRWKLRKDGELAPRAKKSA